LLFEIIKDGMKALGYVAEIGDMQCVLICTERFSCPEIELCLRLED